VPVTVTAAGGGRNGGTSRPLNDPGWGPTTVITGDVAAALTTLNQQPGGDIAVGASGTPVRFLLQAGLLDERTVFVHAVVAGAGRHLFEDGDGQVPLTLLESRAHHNGVVALRYSGRAYDGLISLVPLDASRS